MNNADNGKKYRQMSQCELIEVINQGKHKERDLKIALCAISDMCIGEITMNYKLDAEYIGQVIYQATGKSNPDLHDEIKALLQQLEGGEDE